MISLFSKAFLRFLFHPVTKFWLVIDFRLYGKNGQVFRNLYSLTSFVESVFRRRDWTVAFDFDRDDVVLGRGFW